MTRLSSGRFLVCLLLACASVSASAFDGNLRYRVAGIIYTSDKQLAVIEKSDDTQGLYRPGDLLETYRITSINPDGVHLHFLQGGKDIFLPLQGRPTLLADVSASIKAGEMQVTDGNATLTVDFEDVKENLASITGSRPRGVPPPEVTGTAHAESGVAQRMTVGQSVNAAVGLQSYTNITKVNRTVVEGPRQAAQLMERELDAGRSVRLEVGGSIAGVDVLYLSPSGEMSRGAAGQ